jgi:hypothetical protein
MPIWHWLHSRLSPEHLGWFGAGLSAAALGVVGYQLISAALLAGPLPGPQPAPQAAGRFPERTPTPTSTPVATRTPRPTWTPTPTRTPSPTRTPTPTPPDPAGGVASVLATLTIAEPDAVVAVVATFAARTNAALEPLMTPRPQR